jgi:hypothetical protein
MKKLNEVYLKSVKILSHPTVTLFYAYTAKNHTENSKQIFPEKELRGLRPNFHIHVSVSDLYLPKIGSYISLQPNR